ncbi:MAG TPA: FMN-binding negative transcriptional regulator [Steroidobacteraceae bacterium]
MYIPEQFRETRIDVLEAFIERHSLATLIAMTAEGLTANHIPLRSHLSADGRGIVRGHIARANSLWRELKPDAEVLAVFMGADSYISPRWYPSKKEHGKVVPTWNYATVHLHGSIRFIEDAAWLRDFVGSLTEVHEAGRADRWQVSDAPADYIDAMLRAIVGLEIKVSRVVGKFKGSQNRSAADRAGVNAGLRATGRSVEEVAEIAPGS